MEPIFKGTRNHKVQSWLPMLSWMHNWAPKMAYIPLLDAKRVVHSKLVDFYELKFPLSSIKSSSLRDMQTAIEEGHLRADIPSGTTLPLKYSALLERNDKLTSTFHQDTMQQTKLLTQKLNSGTNPLLRWSEQTWNHRFIHVETETRNRILHQRFISVLR